MTITSRAFGSSNQRLRRATLTALIGIWILSGCGPNPDSGGGPDTLITGLEIAGGDAQDGIAGQMLPTALSVVAHDSLGQPAAGVEILWTVVSGGGTLSEYTTLTDGLGGSAVTWTLGGSSTQQVVRAASPGLNSSVFFGATIPQTSPAGLRATGGQDQFGIPTTFLRTPLAIQLLDSAGAPIAGRPVSWSVLTGGGALTPASPVTDAEGRANVRWALGPDIGQQFVGVTATGFGGDTLVFQARAESLLTVVGGGNNLDGNLSSDLWIHGGIAYTGRYGGPPGDSGNRVMIWRLSASGAPILVDSLVIPGIGFVSDLEVSPDGSLLLVTSQGQVENGLHLYSLSDDPIHPELIGHRRAGTIGLHTGTFGVIGGQVYIFASRWPDSWATPAISPALMVYRVHPELADPIVEVATVVQPANYGIHDQFIRDGLAFLSVWNSGLRIYDVGNGMAGGTPGAPVLLSTIVTSTSGFSGANVHNAWWYHDTSGGKQYVFVGQETGGIMGASSGGNIHVVDVSNLLAPVEVAEYGMSGAGTHNFWVDEENAILYAAYYEGGVVALDISGTLSGDLASREIARTQPGGPANTSTWGVMLYGSSLYAIDILSGLWQLSAR